MGRKGDLARICIFIEGMASKSLWWTERSVIKRTGNDKMTLEALKQELAVWQSQQACDVR